MHRRRQRGFRVWLLLGICAAVTAGSVIESVGAPADAMGALAATRTIRSGHARFQVLSPGLLRLEYSASDIFTDAGTFNAIGRDSFASTDYTSRIEGGWLIIDTAQVSLRYRIGSGEFTEDNVSMTLTNGGQRVTARPSWPTSAPLCRFATRCEAEDGGLGSVGVAADHGGYTGRGFVAGFEVEAASTSYRVTVPSAGTYDLAVRYANATGGDNRLTQRTLGVAVNGSGVAQLRLPVSGSWESWATARVALTLPAGTQTIMVVRGAADSGMVNLDSLALIPQPAAFPNVPNADASCVFSAPCELDRGELTGTAAAMTDHNGASGGAFLAGLQNTSSSVTTSVAGIPADGQYVAQLRYANNRTGDDPATPRTISLSVNGGAPIQATLPVTSSWDSWTTAAVPITLRQGRNSVRVGCPFPDSCHLNLDTIAVAAAGSPTLAPHAPLSGYRRGLDNVDGPASLTPGLLFEDGWYLLDDTASAVFDPATDQLSDRPGSGAGTYQDGYLFGYGLGYKQSLRDLITLTGAPTLLPRWAYGVWYSKYEDYTAAMYRTDVLPAFRRNGVPLDVLVTDTDFKAPDTWDGWQFDRTKFPDPVGFLDWSADQGLQNTMNIHPSVVTNDPKYPQAQLTAKNKLTRNNDGCYTDTSHIGDCYVFDWSDPDQLKSYLDLHREMEDQGVDFWWLDWCCEQSGAAYSGVTPDAWINHQYAQRAGASVGRGFVLSRAFGSLQSGGYGGPTGVPTGPWADKRSTVHFTGDTSSTWASLRFQVGYTGGQAATTGLSAISHDIGGFNANRANIPEDLYVRWVQLGAFQPIFRLHGNHSGRLPWDYGAQAQSASSAFMNLRENLVPFTYTLAQEAARTGVPVVRPTYLEYPQDKNALAAAGGQYFYGPDVLVAPITTAGPSASTTVWFPPGRWTDYFTGRTYTGPSTATVTADWNAMPVFLRAGAIVPQRGRNVANDVQNPLDTIRLTVAGGANGSFALYEDDGTTPGGPSATTTISYAERAGQKTLTIGPADGSFPGQLTSRRWTPVFTNSAPPIEVSVNGLPLAPARWTWDAAKRTVTVDVGAAPTGSRTTVVVR